jgi:tRNA nucleotidyltransferase (CCA-adding enzyme)
VLAACLDLEPDEATADTLRGAAASVATLESFRIGREWRRIFSEPFSDRAVLLARRLGVLRHLVWELDRHWDFDQRSRHHTDRLGDHSLAVLRAMCRMTGDPDLRMAALLHDIGKPGSAWSDEQGQLHYYAVADFTAGQAAVGAKLAEERLVALGLEPRRVERVTRLIELHMFAMSGDPRRDAMRLIDEAGSVRTVRDLLTLRRADAAAKGQTAPECDAVERCLMGGEPARPASAEPVQRAKPAGRPWPSARGRRRRGSWRRWSDAQEP